jgi:hypothetical protein
MTMTTRTINLVLQGSYGNACQQACLAMLAGVPLSEVISFIGDHRLSREDHDKVCAYYGIEIDPVGYRPAWMDTYRVGKMAKDHSTLLVSQFDWLDTAFSHCVLLHNGMMYDPAMGINPHWPWTRVIGMLSPVLKAPCK